MSPWRKLLVRANTVWSRKWKNLFVLCSGTRESVRTKTDSGRQVLQPGVVVTVHRVNPAFCIKFENTGLVLDEEIARNIFVWKVDWPFEMWLLITVSAS